MYYGAPKFTNRIKNQKSVNKYFVKPFDAEDVRMKNSQQCRTSIPWTSSPFFNSFYSSLNLPSENTPFPDGKRILVAKILMKQRGVEKRNIVSVKS